MNQRYPTAPRSSISRTVKAGTARRLPPRRSPSGSRVAVARGTSAAGSGEATASSSSRGSVRVSLVTGAILLVLVRDGPTAWRRSARSGGGDGVGVDELAEQTRESRRVQRTAPPDLFLRRRCAAATAPADVLLASDVGPVLVVAVPRVRVGAVDHPTADRIGVDVLDRALAARARAVDVTGAAGVRLSGVEDEAEVRAELAVLVPADDGEPARDGVRIGDQHLLD